MLVLSSFNLVLLGASIARLPRDPVAPSSLTPPDIANWPETPRAMMLAEGAQVFQAPPRGPRQPVDSLAARFRLAGTFVESGGVFNTRKAVLDDRRSGRQVIASESDRIDGIEVVRIKTTSVLLRGEDGVQEEIHLGFRDAHSPAGDSVGDARESQSGFLSDAAAFQIKQVGENSWVFQRDRILDYYAELRDNPERLLAVFDSMKPERDESGAIEGYRLIVEGEAEFFRAAGLKENDIVRSVNKRQLANRRIAEAFIADFITDQANAFVLEIERDGKTEDFVYQVR